MQEVIVLTYFPNNQTAKVLLEAVGANGQDLFQKYTAELSVSGKQDKKEVIPEIDVYIAILIQVRILSTRPSGFVEVISSFSYSD